MNELLQYLQSQRQEKFSFKDQDPMKLVLQSLDYIGDCNSDIRDNIVYPALAHLLHDKHLTTEQLCEITHLLISNKFLLYDIKNEEQWSVLRRSFTLLQLAMLVYVHNRDNVWDEAIAFEVYDCFMKYIEHETVYTGYHKEVGWVHAIAHSADLMTQLVQMKELTQKHIDELWDVARKLFAQDHYLFVSDEDERIVSMLEKSWTQGTYSDEKLLLWIENLINQPLPNDFPARYILKQNVSHLCRSLFFRLEESLPSGTLYSSIKHASKNRR